MDKHRAGPLLNIGLIAAFLFSILMSYYGLTALLEFFFAFG